MRKEIRYLIGTRQIFWATVIAIHFKKYGIVLGEVNLNNTIVEHMNIFPHSFRKNKNFTAFRKSVKVGDRIKLEGRIGDYNKIEDGIEVTDYCLRDINILKINTIINDDKSIKRICATTVTCPNCGRTKIIEVFENKNTKEQTIKCKKECNCNLKYDVKYTYVNGKLNIRKIPRVDKSKNYGLYNKPSFNGMIDNMVTL